MTRWFKILRSYVWIFIIINLCTFVKAHANRVYTYTINNCTLDAQDSMSGTAELMSSAPCTSRNQEHTMVIPEAGISAWISRVSLYAGPSPTRFCSSYEVISANPISIIGDLYINDQLKGRTSAFGVEHDGGYRLCFIQNGYSSSPFQLNPKDKIAIKLRLENVPAEFKSWKKIDDRDIGMFFQNRFFAGDGRSFDLTLLYESSVNPPSANSLTVTFLPNTISLTCAQGRPCEGQTRMSITYSGAPLPASCTFNFDKKALGIYLYYGAQKINVQPDNPIVFNNVSLVDKLLFDIKNINVGTSQRHVVNASCTSI